MGIAKQLKFGEEARKEIKEGIDTLARAVGSTLGPKGRNVLIENKFLPPTITKDGVTVARQVDLEDPFQEQGNELGKVVAAKTVDTAGDGTTTAVILAQAIYTEGLRIMSSGVNPILLKRGMDIAVEEVVNRLKVLATPISGNKKAIQNVATIASNVDKPIGELITKAVSAVGENGVITIEDSPSPDTYLDVVEGMQLVEGMVSPWFINKPYFECKYKKPAILCVDKEIRDAQELIPIFEKCIKAGKPFVIIADTVSGTALSTLILNKRQNNHKVLAVKAPGYGDSRKSMLEDIAIFCGTHLMSPDIDIDLTKLELADLGSCETITATRETCVIVKGKGDKKNIDARIEEIRMEVMYSESDHDKEKLNERLAKLTAGVAVLKIGAPTDTEMREKKMRVEDALHATRAAIEEGIVPGGGIALYRAGQQLPELKLTNEEGIGYNIIRDILDKPLRKIVENAGLDGAEVIANIKNRKVNYGLDVLKMKYGDMIKNGVIDPVKVVRLTLQNASSLAGMALTADCIIVEKPEEKEKDYKPQRGGR